MIAVPVAVAVPCDAAVETDTLVGVLVALSAMLLFDEL